MLCNHRFHPLPERCHHPQLELTTSSREVFATLSPRPPGLTAPLCVYGSDCSGDLREMKSYTICPFVTGFSLSTTSSRFLCVTACVKFARFLAAPATYGLLVPQRGIKPRPLQWALRALNTEPPGRSQNSLPF